MTEPTVGWNLDMQIRVAALRLRILEMPVHCRPRQGGTSKISGNWRVLLLATATMVVTFLRLALVLHQSGVK